MEWIPIKKKNNEDFLKSYNGESDEEYFLGADVQCPQNLHNFHNDLQFLPERMKIEKSKGFLHEKLNILYIQEI